MIVISSALTLLPPILRLISFDPPFSAMSVTIRPRDFSWSVTICLDSASTTPSVLLPVRSIALKT